MAGELAIPLIGSIVNSASSIRSQEQQNEFNMRMINEQNAYNSPSAVIRRMIAAGIPLKAAQRSVAGVPSIGEQKSVATAASPTNNLAQDFANVYQAILPTMQAKADARLKNAQAEGLELDNKLHPQRAEDAHNQALATIENLRAQHDVYVSQKEINEQEKTLKEIAVMDAQTAQKYLEPRLYEELMQLSLSNDVAFETLLFDLYTFQSRADQIDLTNANLSAEEKEHLALARQVWQIVNTNAPEEQKAKHITELRNQHPAFFKLWDTLRPKGNGGMFYRFLMSLGKAGKFMK